MNLDRFHITHFQTQRLLSREYEVFLGYSQTSVVDRWAANYLQAKLGGNPVRAQFTFAMADWLLSRCAPWQRWCFPTAKRDLLLAQLPFISELVISVQYLHNQVLDGKAGVTSRTRIADNLLLANLLQAQLYRYIDGEIPARYRTLVTTHIRQCFEWVDIGQQLERQANNYDQMHQHDLSELLPASLRAAIDLQAVGAFIDKTKQDLPRFLHQELDHYFHRIYLTCAALFVSITQLSGRILRVPDEQMHTPLQFSICYGVMRQLVNDNADWVSTAALLHTQEKHATDASSDLRNKTLTLPLFFWLAEPRSDHLLIQQLLQDQRPWDPSLQADIFAEMLGSYALFRAVQHTRILAELALAFLPAERADLAQACGIAHWNKFLVPVLRHSTYQDFRRTPAHRQTKKLIKQLRRARQQPPAKVSTRPTFLPWRNATSASPTLPLSAHKALWLLRG